MNSVTEAAKPTAEPLIAASKKLAWIWISFGLIGWIAAMALVLEKLHVLEHPSDALSCDLNVFISCKSVMAGLFTHQITAAVTRE